MPNLAAILLGRVDLRVDRQCFRNHIKIQDFLRAFSHVSECRSGTGRHGGHPSQMPGSDCRSGAGRHGGHPSQMPEANIAAVPDDTEVVPPKCSRSESLSGIGRHGGHPSQEHRAKVIAENSAPLREITVPAKPPPIQDCSESSTAHTAESGLIPRFVALSPGVKPVAPNPYPQRTIF